MARARILLADDHRGMLDIVGTLLAEEFDVVAAVENGELAISAASAHDPDVVILDLSMPVMNGIDATCHLKKAGSRAKVILLTVQAQPELVTAALAAGALGYVLKPRLATDLIPAIREVLNGRVFSSVSLEGLGEYAGTARAAEIQRQQTGPAPAKEGYPNAPTPLESPRRRWFARPFQGLSWRPGWATVGVAALAAMITLAVLFARMASRGIALRRQVDAQQRQIAELGHGNSALRADLDRVRKLIAAQQLEAQELRAALQSKAKDTAFVSRNSTQLRAEADKLSAQNARLSADLQNREKLLAAAKAELERIEKASAADRASVIAQQYRINELSEQLRAARAGLDLEHQLAAAGRDVRELLGARQLHVVDVRDTDATGKPHKAFGRVFLTEGKSLIFYAFDLNDGKPLAPKHSFQVWGEYAGKRTPTRNLGLLYMDDKAQKRWALNVENPALLKEIDAVFVTIEPPGGGKKPSGQRLLYAYLGEANHP